MAIDPYEAASRYLTSVERYEDARASDIAMRSATRVMYPGAFNAAAPVAWLSRAASGLALNYSVEHSEDPAIASVRLGYHSSLSRAEAIISMSPENAFYPPDDLRA